MEQKDLIKYAAIAAGAYIVYRWYMAQQTPQVTGGQQAPPPGQTTQPPAPPPTQPPAQSTAVPGMATEADFTRWATDFTAAQSAPRDKVLTFDEWNYYRGTKGGRPIVDALAVNGISASNRGTMKLDAQTYWNLMRQVDSGMAGMDGMGGFYFSGTGFVTDYGWLM